VVSGIVLGIIAAAVVAATVAAFRGQSAKSTRRVSAIEEVAAAAWKGGLRTRTVNSTAGTARLELFGWGVRVRGRGLWQALLPTWEVRYGELTAVHLIEWPLGNSGVMLRADGSAVPLVFFTFRGREVLDALELRGVPVDRSVSRLRRADLAEAS
jgi:hypothetical protein